MWHEAELRRQMYQNLKQPVGLPLTAEHQLFCYTLSKLRNGKKLSQGDLGNILDMDQSAIARLESDKANPTLQTLLKVAHALDAQLMLQSVKLES